LKYAGSLACSLVEVHEGFTMAGWKQTIILGIALGVAVIGAVIGSHLWLCLPLLVIAVLLFAWALEPQRTEAFIGRLPYGSYPLKALAKLDSIISAWS
jgi:hypothetical protein